jgi:uncharacterized surface protein with fasciclin (FAS1) repeats
MICRISPALALAGALVLGGCADGIVSPTPLSPDAALESRGNAPAQANRAPAPGNSPIAAIAIAAGFDELVAALGHVDAELDAGLVDLFLNGTDQYTVFAPTDEAFNALYGTLGVDGITDLPPELVLDVLLYHVAEGRRAANSVVPRVGTRTIETLLGATFQVTTAGQILDIAGQTATIDQPNISASNGIIHVIDTVLLPLGG